MNKERQIYDMLQNIANKINNKLPEKMGFVLLAYEFGDKKDNRKMVHVSNSNRADVVKIMLEFIDANLNDHKIYRKNDI